MDDPYLPPSEFLRAIIDDEADLLDESGLRRLISMTSDDDLANRDWATLLLAQQDNDTPEVRTALLAAANDANEYVRSEAILGLARRDKGVALPFLQRELANDTVPLPIFEAAGLVADASLVEDLRFYASPSGDEVLDELALTALKACESGKATSA